MIEVGDWVIINCPEKPWFHGEMGEVVRVWPEGDGYGKRHAADVAFSKTPGHRFTRWYMEKLLPLPRSESDPMAALGEDYFA